MAVVSDAIPPELAHLYGDLSNEPDPADEGAPPRPEPKISRATSLEALTEETGEEEDADDHDVEELAILVKARQDAGTSSDEFLAEIGLGSFVPIEVESKDPGTDKWETEADVLFHLNRLGLRVTRRLAEWEGLIPEGATGIR